MTDITLAVADDQVLFLKGLRLLIQFFPNIDLIIEATNGLELLAAVDREQPDVILMDLKMPEMDGLEATAKIKDKYPEIKIILLSSYNEEHLIHHLMKIGANGYLLKNEEPEVLREAIETVMEKDFYFNDYVAQALLNNIHNPSLTNTPWSTQQNLQISAREKEVLDLICREHTSAEIAEQLYISIRTVENHRKSLLAKTGVRNTAGLILFAVTHQLIDPEKYRKGR